MIKEIDDDLFDIFQAWCTGHGWPQAPRELFPKRGYMAHFGPLPVIAGWLYRDPDSAYSMMEYVVANPNATHEQKALAFHELAQHMFGVASELGAKIMHMAISSSKKSFGKKLEAEGFQITDRDVTLYLKPLVPTEEQ